MSAHKLTAHQLAANQFCWTGQLVRFAEGKKSPRQCIVIKVACVHSGDDALLTSSSDTVRSVSLGKSLRRMMMGYLSPLDWLRVVGTCKVDARSGELIWKAQEIIKLSAAQVQSVESCAFPPQRLQEKVGEKSIAARQPVRVLICQQSSCQRRGSVAVSQVIGDALNVSSECSQVSVQAVGCLKNCKLGPNVVLFPKEKLRRQGLATRYDNVTPAAAREIVNGLDMALGSLTD